ncbi:hypothetical protein E4U13_007923 [Claviceps humidiphila]|uniref:Uncharacterized protein n=1 Tax=Claviceps humidiphila TaxID=1294629 RepID=A0A9P7Q3X9_9HYPO|nr:hypothetical protein E4U13_007923 [Claviceps humidiphila]
MERPGDYFSSSSSSRSTSPLPTPSPARKADSGVTRTVPSSSLVTVTRHGVVFSESPSSEKAAASRGLCSTCAPASTFTSSPSTDVSERGSPSAGAIAGAAIAAAIIIIIIIILSIGKSELMLVFVLRRRKKHQPSCDTSEAETLGSDSGATGSEKLNSLKDAFSRMSKDPFAPFGGRVDKPDYPYRPSTGTFELDGVAITVVELPATSVPEVSGPVNMAATVLDKASKPDTVKTALDKASEPETVKTATDEASEPDTVKAAAAATNEASDPDIVKRASTAPDEDTEPDIVKTAPDEASEPDTVETAATATDEASDPDIVKTATTAPDEASEMDIVKAAAAVSDEASEPDTVKTASDEDFEPDTVKTAPDEASEPDTVDTAAKAPYEASDLDIVETAARAPDKASEPRTAPPTPEPAATLASPSSPQGKIAYNINIKADAGANAESFDRTRLSSKESHPKQKQLALERKANKPLADEVQRHQVKVACDLSVHVGILYLKA